MKKNDPARVAFFGGSFDPPHGGHLRAARGALLSGRTDKVLFVPAYRPPHKLNAQQASFEARCRMVELLIAGEAGMELCDIENRLKLSPSYTIEVLEALERELGQPVQLLIGGDSLRDLHDWYRSEELVQDHEVLTYPRRDAMPLPEQLLDNWGAELAQKLDSGILSGEFFEISSTLIRTIWGKSGSFSWDDAIVPSTVMDYIQTQHLYDTTGKGEGLAPECRLA